MLARTKVWPLRKGSPQEASGHMARVSCLLGNLCSEKQWVLVHSLFQQYLLDTCCIQCKAPGHNNSTFNQY